MVILKELFTVSNQLFLFSFLCLVGGVSVKLKILTCSALDGLSKFIVNITMPLILFTTITNGPDINEFKNITSILLLYPLLLGLLFLISNAIIKIFHVQDERKNLFRATFVFGNTGFIGIPLIISLFPQTGIVYMSGCMVIDQLLLWTVGMWWTKPIEKTKEQSFFKDVNKMINPSVISILFAVLCLIFNLHLPNFLNGAFSQVGNLTTTLALICIGGMFCFADKKSMVKNVETYLIVIIKMLSIPLLLFFIFKQIGKFTEQTKVMLILLALPSMSSLIMFSRINNSDSDYVLSNVTLTTIFGLFTIHILLFLFG